MSRIRIAFMASKVGSNFQAIVEACQNGQLNAEPVLLISNNSKAQALERAKNLNVPKYCIELNSYESEEAWDNAIYECLKEYEPDLVCLAGFLNKIGDRVLSQFKIINIHPSLLPKYGGHGMYGRHVHNAVIDAGENESGASIHIVTKNYDEGPVLAQKKIELSSNETPETLEKRVRGMEKEFYIETIQKIISGNIKLT